MAYGSRTGAIDLRPLAVRGAVALVSSVAVNVVVLWIVLGAELAEPFDPLSYPPVALFTALGAVGAAVVYGVVTRVTENPDRTFTVVAAVVLVLSYVPDLALLESDPGATVPGVLALMVMHTTAAAVCVLALTDAGIGGLLE